MIPKPAPRCVNRPEPYNGAQRHETEFGKCRHEASPSQESCRATDETCPLSQGPDPQVEEGTATTRCAARADVPLLVEMCESRPATHRVDSSHPLAVAEHS